MAGLGLSACVSDRSTHAPPIQIKSTQQILRHCNQEAKILQLPISFNSVVVGLKMNKSWVAVVNAGKNDPRVCTDNGMSSLPFPKFRKEFELVAGAGFEGVVHVSSRVAFVKEFSKYGEATVSPIVRGFVVYRIHIGRRYPPADDFNTMVLFSSSGKVLGSLSLVI